MPKLLHKLPKYRRHSGRDCAFVQLQGKRIYLDGKFGSAESRQQYRKLCLEWETNGRPSTPTPKAHELTIMELMLQYLKWARKYYGPQSREVTAIALACRPLKELYGRTPVIDFGPKALKALRKKMIDSDLCRNEVNKRIGRIKRLFKWGTSEELVPASIFHGLQAVGGLSRGRSEARESDPVKPVPDAFVDAVRDHVTPQVWEMIELQRYTGARPGEIATMRTADIDTTGKVWLYTPQKHKNSYRGHERKIYIGPKAKAVLKPWLRRNLEEFLFQPKEAVQWLLAQRAANRKTPLSCGNRPGTNRKKSPKREPTDNYTTSRYAIAIKRGCIKADVPHWHPHQLRHNAATFLRKQFGLDIARAVLGHRSAAITETYAELDGAAAMKIMGEVG